MSKVCYGCFKNVEDNYRVCPHCGFGIEEYTASERVLQPGTVLNGKYVIGKTLGEGGFGITYLAWDRNMEIKIAIKEYYPGNLVIRDATAYGGNTLHTVTGEGKMDFEAGLQRYVKEAAILSKFFNLPGIVSVKDFFYENGTAYMAMEYIDGISLKEYLKQRGNTVPVAEALEIVKPIITSLAIVHQNKLLHRDISPDNIMISQNGQVKLIDFGAARYFESDYDKSMTVVLKHGYAPLEQYSRKGEQGEATDIYSLCAVIYRMVTGVIPEEAIERIHQDKLRPMREYNKKIPQHISEAIDKGLSIEQKNRQQNMQELYSDLFATKKQLREKRGNWVYNTVWKMLVGLILLLLMVIAGSLLFIVNRDKITSFEDKVQRVFMEEEQAKETTEEPIAEQKKTTEKVTEQSAEEAEETSVKTEQESGQTENLVQQETVPDEPENQANVYDEEIEHAIIVVSQGVLNGKSEEYTVEDILNFYCGKTGQWTGRRDNNGALYVSYLGSKMGSEFTLEFQVFSGDTFKLVGATRNGEEYEQYSTFFQEILDEVGI